ncbi:NRDE protein-domain-containing protein [Crucibulum laeve]|uniref:NRDE protein-domain-containing protein n=1 Tax=Crucibulum laeve TaxID=68775 RepID=A0A5C3LPE4_9AGAR|nr:NRDE protein-domain-containing protein [Crucibulum laeve]
MCIGVWTLDHPDYSLILCTNRDEFLDRPTEEAHFHSFENKVHPENSGNILSGRDVKAGGSWLGLNRAGRVALLTNITEPTKEYNTSRGYLVSSFLLSDSFHPLEDEVGKIVPQDAKFAGFNLVLFAPLLRPDGSLYFDTLLVTNHGGGGTLTSRPLSPGERFCGGVSNGIDGAGATDWPKVKHATKDLDTILQTLTPDTTETELTDRLFELLSWRSPEPIAQRSQLRNTVHVVPVPIILEGSHNVMSTFYGTRLSTVILVRRDGEVLFIERDIWKLLDGEAVKTNPPTERRFRFKLNIQKSP